MLKQVSLFYIYFIRLWVLSLTQELETTKRVSSNGVVHGDNEAVGAAGFQ